MVQGEPHANKPAKTMADHIGCLDRTRPLQLVELRQENAEAGLFVNYLLDAFAMLWNLQAGVLARAAM
jgi:hypothetical protein